MTVLDVSAALDDDLNVSKAWGVIFEWIRGLNRTMAEGKLSVEQAILALGTWKGLDAVLGLNLRVKSAAQMREDDTARGVVPGVGFAVSIVGEEKAPDEIRTLAAQRMQAKKAKNFQLADAIREQMKSKGWMIEDTPKGVKLKQL